MDVIQNAYIVAHETLPTGYLMLTTTKCNAFTGFDIAVA